MVHKKFFIFLLFILFFAAGAGTGWFLFQQSTRLKNLQQRTAPGAGTEVRQAVQTDSGSPEAGSTSISGGRSSGENSTTAQTPGADTAGNGSSVTESFFSQDLIRDAARLLVDRYHPPGSPGCSPDRGMVQISFKTINSRYGADFLTVHTPDTPVKKARKLIIDSIMQPKVLQRLYAAYADDMVRTLQHEAKNAVKTFTVHNGTDSRRLTSSEKAEMFSLYAAYFHDVARMLGAMAHNPELIRSTQRYVQAEEAAGQANYRFNQARNMALRRERGSGEADAAKGPPDTETAAKKYRQALQAREAAKDRLLQAIRQEVPDLELRRGEIEYIAKWVNRRHQNHPDLAGLNRASELLLDFGRRLQDEVAAM